MVRKIEGQVTDIQVKAEDLRVQVNGTEILKGINLDARQGEILSIIGPAGAGKTTFLRCLNRMAELDLDFKISGNILLDGQSIYDSDVAMLRRQIGMVFSVPVPLPMTVYDNLTFGLRLASGPAGAMTSAWKRLCVRRICGTK